MTILGLLLIAVALALAVSGGLGLGGSGRDSRGLDPNARSEDRPWRSLLSD